MYGEMHRFFWGGTNQLFQRICDFWWTSIVSCVTTALQHLNYCTLFLIDTPTLSFQIVSLDTMGRHFGDLAKIRHVITYSLSPFEQRAFPNYFSKGIPNVWRRFTSSVFKVAPRKYSRSLDVAFWVEPGRIFPCYQTSPSKFWSQLYGLICPNWTTDLTIS